MSSKIANVIALELGIVIAVLSWLAFSNVSSVKRRTPAPAEQSRTFATVTPLLKAGSQAGYGVDYRAYQDAQDNEDQAAAPQQDDQEAGTEPYDNSGVDQSVVGATSPAGVGIYPEPVLTEPDCFVSPYDQYSQPAEIIVISNGQSFGHRRRATSRFAGPRMMVAHRHPGAGEFRGARMPVTHPNFVGAGSRARGAGLVSSRNVNARAGRPAQAVRSR
ncbi:MAG: hypothetical protein ACREIF_00760 [Chthoniobacterales bacterium]